MPFFSIIIPTFNSATTLSKTLESVLSQTFSDLEILILDGLSTDNTLEIINKLKDKRIKVWSEKDKGIYDAMNKGLEHAGGQWIYFLGSDDTLYNEHVFETVAGELMKDKSINVLYGNVHSKRFGGIYDGMFSFAKLMEKNICHQSIFFNKMVFIETGNFNLKYVSQADWDHNIKWFLSKTIHKKYIDIVVADYADNGFSSQNRDLVFLEDMQSEYILKGGNKLQYNFKYPILKKRMKKLIKAKEYKNAFVLLVRTPFILF